MFCSNPNSCLSNRCAFLLLRDTIIDILTLSLLRINIINIPYDSMVDFAKISTGWHNNTTIEPLAISKLLLIVRAWINEQNKISNLLSISHKARLKPKPDYGKILR